MWATVCDCLWALLISKLDAYGFSTTACMLMANYFKDRKQLVKLDCNRTEWMNIKKGAAQGSQIGPFIYNVFSNDLMYFMENICDIFNYAEDNTICVHGNDIDEIVKNIEDASNVIMTWFQNNNLQANPEKFQFILFNKQKLERSISVDGVSHVSQSCVQLLGVNIDHALNFDIHIKYICRKAGRHLNVLARLSSTLNTKEKMLLFESFILSYFNYCPLV